MENNEAIKPIEATTPKAFESSDEFTELFAAVSKAQGIMDSAKKDKKNPFFKSSYADLSSCWDAIRKPLADNGLSIIQLPLPTGKVATVKTVLTHSSGQWIACTVEIMPTKPDPQSMGSAITYARRYGLMAVIGIAPEDDDANEASKPRAQDLQAKEPANFHVGKKEKTVTANQIKRLHAIVNNSSWTPDEVKKVINDNYGVDSSKKLTMFQYDELCKLIQGQEEPDFDKPLN